eukprot:TRINITY_DN11357_c0_g2_i2.p1 TRINITY_DN11357_c0_g2~~TRINITY_DN11357_c0_g2_i2.p1  ORF type:complete len:306 (-),score=25.21 TRINITY_DN11357_c0_g2_i2:264-1181(-)
MSIVEDDELDALRFSIDEFIDTDVQKKIDQYSRINSNICKFFQKGNCVKGDQCQYRHTKGEKAVVCKHWLRGLCKKNELCEFLHEYDLTKMPPCHFYATYGQCLNEECLFLHVNPEERIKECPWYNRGFCKHGPHCRNRHVRKQACANYLAGFCPLGPNCELGHPKYELPAEDGRGVTPIICHKCGNSGHRAANCTVFPDYYRHHRNYPSRPLNEVTCYKCGEVGHYAHTCTNTRVFAPGTFRTPAVPHGPGSSSSAASASASASAPAPASSSVAMDDANDSFDQEYSMDFSYHEYQSYEVDVTS